MKTIVQTLYDKATDLRTMFMQIVRVLELHLIAANYPKCIFTRSVLLSFSFWPGSLLYMCTVLPAIWVAELNILEMKKSANGTCELEDNQVIRYTSIGPVR